MGISALMAYRGDIVLARAAAGSIEREGVDALGTLASRGPRSNACSHVETSR